MEQNWKYKTINNPENTISLHDHTITEWERGDGYTAMIFGDGFDVDDENENNRTGRHLQTGKSAIILRGGDLISAEKPRHQIIAPGKPVEDFPAQPVENFDYIGTSWFIVEWYKYKPEEKLFEIGILDCHNYGNITLVFNCTEVCYLWNDYTGNAWYEREHRRWAAAEVFERFGFECRYIKYKNSKIPDFDGMPENFNKYPVYVCPESGTVYKMCLDSNNFSFYIGSAPDMAMAEDDSYEVAARFDDSLTAAALAVEVEKWLKTNNMI